jgi:hypothetical protein
MSVNRVSYFRRENGSVMVIVALLLPLMAIFGSFAIDSAHFWDFSRNLQNRVDAAVLAAGSEYGGACFGTPAQSALNDIGHVAQKYSGVPVGALDANLPYTYGSTTPYQNTIDEPKGDATKFHLVLNGATSADHGGTSFSNGNFCAATYDGQTGPAVDGWVTQENVPLFFKMFGFAPNISAHARVQLQGAASVNSVPIAVPDPAQTPCLRAEVINDLTGALVTDSTGKAIDVAMTPPNPTGTPPQNLWTATLPTMTVPAAQLSVQAYIPDDCNTPGYPTGGTLYDAAPSPGHGLEYVNTYQTYTLPIPSTGTPKIGTVWLTPGGCTDATEGAAQDAYFYYFPKSTNCTVIVHAQADFQTGASPSPRFWVRMDNGNANADIQMTADTPATDGAGRHFWKASFQIPTQSGRHTFQILSSTANGGNPAKTAFNGGNPLQATYSALSDASDPPDDSGPVTQAFIGDNAGATAGVNSIQQGTPKTLTVAFRLQGLQLAAPTDPPIVLRVSVNNRKATGAFDCWGNTSSATALHDAIVNGCPNPISVYSPTQGCVFLPTTPLTCADLVPGNKRTQVVNAFEDRVKSAVDNGNPSPCDMWQSFKTGTPISGFEPWNSSIADSRIIVMAVTQPTDLSGGGGPVNSVKILGFAAFYITGWDKDPWLPNGNGNGGTKIPNCSAPTNQDEAYPGTGSSNNQIWGHFIKYVAAGSSNGQPCIVTDVSVCVPALTR